MAEEEISQISVGEFDTIPQLIASSESLQLAFVFLILGLLVIGVIYHKFSRWIYRISEVCLDGTLGQYQLMVNQ
jgi:hypothetical protein